jgi:hypothetical protein
VAEAFETSSQGQPRADGDAMPQQSRAHLHTGRLQPIGVPLEVTVKLTPMA